MKGSKGGGTEPLAKLQKQVRDQLSLAGRSIGKKKQRSSKRDPHKKRVQEKRETIGNHDSLGAEVDWISLTAVGDKRVCVCIG